MRRGRERATPASAGDETARREDPPRSSGAFPARLLAAGALLWLAAVVCAGTFHVSLPGTAWHDEGLPVMARVTLLGLEFILLAYPALFLALLALLCVGRGGDGRAASSWVSRTLRSGAVGLALWLVAFAYVASWLAFRSTGHFLNLVTLRLWWSNSIQMLQHVTHMEPFTPLVALLGTLGFAAGFVVLLRRSARLGRRGAHSISALAGALLVTCFVLPLVTDSGAVQALFEARRTEATGPLTHFVSHLRSRLAASADPTFRRVEPVVDRRPIVPMATYLDASTVRPRHNVLLIVVESLRPDQLRAYGGERAVMPTLDALADSGRVFARHYTQASHSDYADPTLLSSHYPLRSRTYHIYPEEPAYPRVLVYDVLGSIGYRVGVFSSQNESWGGMKHYLQTGSVDRFLHSETYEGPTYVPDRDPGFATWVKGARKSGKIDDRFTVSEAIEWIAGGSEPFFIYMNLQNSHVPYVVPADFEPPFGPGRVSFPLRFGDFPRDSVDAVKDLYASSLAYVDAQIGRLIDFLRREGRWEETVVIVTGDTGQAFYEHGFASHASALYDEVMRVPLVIRAPGLAPGRETAPSQHVDVPPTLLGLLGLPPHPSFQGSDLLSGAGPAGERTLFLMGQALVHQYAVVRGRWKLLYDAGTRGYELYDLEKDPGELENLAPARPRIVDRLAPTLHAWRKAQLEYYADPTAYRRWYPPRLTGVRSDSSDAASGTAAAAEAPDEGAG